MADAWSAFYWADYVADTAHLTLAQHGAYLLLMAHYYRTRRPLSANASVLHRVCRCTTDADKSAVEEVLAEFFTLDGGVYRQHRIDRELAKAADISEKRRAAAKVKHQKSRASAGAHAQEMQVHMHTQSQPQPQSQETRTKAKTCSGAGAPVLPEWVPTEAWAGFVEMRKKTREPLTDRAITLIVKQLERLRAKGHDVGEVLDQSTRNNWRDVYPLKGNHSNENGNRAERRQAANLSALEAAKAQGRLDHGAANRVS
jgi:uncharacterized protein YdaU (DUF1376 family)